MMAHNLKSSMREYKMNNLTLLYAEDDEEVLENTIYLLDGCCPKIYTAKDGQEALKIYKDEKIDIILLDINMPKMSGLDVLKAIREEDSETQVVFVSAFSDSTNLIKAINLGVSAYIVKPYSTLQLKETIKKIADKKFTKDAIDNNVIISHTDKNGYIFEASNAFYKLSQYSKNEIIGKSHKIISHKDTPSSVYENMWEVISSGEVWEGELKNKKKDSSPYWVDLTITPLFTAKNEISGYISVQHDITLKKEMELLSITDGLSGLYNRLYFDKIINIEIPRSKRYDTHFSFMMLDIDYFKQYNDTYGHQAGDIAIKKISDILNQYTKRESDYAFRIGGEEFGLLTIGLDLLTSTNLANNIIKDIKALAIEHKTSLVSDVLTISIGLYNSKGKNIFDTNIVYKQADKALYKSKNNGRDTLSIANTEDTNE